MEDPQDLNRAVTEEEFRQLRDRMLLQRAREILNSSDREAWIGIAPALKARLAIVRRRELEVEESMRLVTEQKGQLRADFAEGLLPQVEAEAQLNELRVQARMIWQEKGALVAQRVLLISMLKSEP